MESSMINLFVTSLVIVMIVGLSVLCLILIPQVPSRVENHSGLDYKRLTQVKCLAKCSRYIAIDGTSLDYRYYPADSDIVLILLHGSGWHSGYLEPLASHLARQGIAKVYTPDLRGHGMNPCRRGDVDYIGQYNDDLTDFIDLIHEASPQTKILLAGHSSGGGLALRFAGSAPERAIDGYLLLAPYLHYQAPTMRHNSGGWARPFIRRIIGLELVNRFGFKALNHLKVISFNLPSAFRDGSETDSYSYRLNKSYAPKHYQRELQAIKVPLLLVVGRLDEAFMAEQYQALIRANSDGDVSIIEDVGHLDLVSNSAAMQVIGKWISEQFSDHV